jgi:hypothetical protein
MMELGMPDNLKKEKPSLTPRQRRYITWGWIIPAVLGLLLGITMMSGSADSLSDIVSGTGRIDRTFGVLAAALAGPAFLTVMYLWHKSLDEQEEHAILWGNTLGLYFGLTLWAVWTFLAATGLVPLVEVGIVVGLSAGLCLAYWVWKKFL